MKIKMLLVGMLSSLFFVGCDKNDEEGMKPGENEETKSVFLQFEAGSTSQTRSVEGNANGVKATLSSALIYFVGEEADPKVYAVRTVGGAGADATITEVTQGSGKEFTGIPMDVKRVYVIGNHDSEDVAGVSATFPTAKGTTLSSIEAVLMNIEQVNYPSVGGNAHTGLATVLYGNGEVVPKQNATQENEFQAHVKVSPINARIELDELAYSGNLKSFTLDGIFINNYYAAAGLASSSFVEGNMTNNGSNTDKYLIGGNEFAYTNFSTMFDEVGTAVTVANEKASMKPAPGNTWAYQVFGGAPEIAHVIVKLSDIVDVNGHNQADQYLTVKGFRDATTDEALPTLDAGKVYRITSLEFDDSHLEIIPEPEKVSIWVTVEIAEWIEVVVKPIV